VPPAIRKSARSRRKAPNPSSIRTPCPFMNWSKLTVFAHALIARLTLFRSRATGVELFYGGQTRSIGITVTPYLAIPQCDCFAPPTSLGRSARLRRAGVDACSASAMRHHIDEPRAGKNQHDHENQGNRIHDHAMPIIIEAFRAFVFREVWD
jgi:hypothetical protein